MSFKYKLFKEMFKMSSAAAEKTSMRSFQIFSTFGVVDPTQPTKNWKISTQRNPTHRSTQPMDNSETTKHRIDSDVINIDLYATTLSVTI